ncbi:hypothetical protein [Streptacidiphilus rugosus]|uniref:hypothetical protein n=1 Tax=Streptacidiphilus rugosus TaxID=405783 RepID=UPI0012F85EBB|nr:hypothetical protein [Streptacidiphilus rugosus]
MNDQRSDACRQWAAQTARQLGIDPDGPLVQALVNLAAQSSQDLPEFETKFLAAVFSALDRAPAGTPVDEALQRVYLKV